MIARRNLGNFYERFLPNQFQPMAQFFHDWHDVASEWSLFFVLCGYSRGYR